MNTVASMGFLAKHSAKPTTAAAPPSAEDTLAKKAAQARARREKKKAGTAATAKPAKPAAPAKTAKPAPKAKPAPVAKPTTAAAPPSAEDTLATTAKPKDATGGAREGAGRKSVYAGEVMKTISFKGTPAHHAEFLAAGGGNWVRAGLDERIAFKKKGGK